MDVVDLAGVLVIGLLAGVAGGLVGVGGGVLFVPGLVFFLDQSQLEAQATSLVAVVLVAVVGARSQHGYGNLRLRDGLIVGLLAPVGVAVGATLAETLPERVLQLAFAGIQLALAVQLIQKVLRPEPPEAAEA